MKKEEIVILRVRPPMGENDTKKLAEIIKNRLSPDPVAVPEQRPIAEADAAGDAVYIEGNIDSKAAKMIGGEVMGYMVQAANAGMAKIVTVKSRKETLRLVGFECPVIALEQKNSIRQAMKHLDAHAEVYFNARKWTANGTAHEMNLCEVKTDVKLADLKDKMKQTLGDLFEKITF